MAGWICPECQRQFGRRNQSHECAPAMSIEGYFASGPAFERPIFEAIAEHLESVGPLQIEALSVGIMFKRTRTFAELRPMRRWVRLSILLSRPLTDPRIVKAWRGGGSRAAYFIDVRTASEVDDELRDWLTEAYFASPE